MSQPHIRYDADLVALLSELLDSGFMLEDDPGFADAQKVRTRGIGSLSDKEWETYGREVRPVLEAYSQSRDSDGLNGGHGRGL